MKNFRAIKDFIDYYHDNTSLELTDAGNCVFLAVVRYEYLKNCIKHKTICRITRNGFTDGAVRLDESAPLVPEIFHLDFNPDFQSYTYDDSAHAFIVEGNSPKMGGKYRVVITPAG